MVLGNTIQNYVHGLVSFFHKLMHKLLLINAISIVVAKTNSFFFFLDIMLCGDFALGPGTANQNSCCSQLKVIPDVKEQDQMPLSNLT